MRDAANFRFQYANDRFRLAVIIFRGKSLDLICQLATKCVVSSHTILHTGEEAATKQIYLAFRNF